MLALLRLERLAILGLCVSQDPAPATLSIQHRVFGRASNFARNGAPESSNWLMAASSTEFQQLQQVMQQLLPVEQAVVVR